MSKSSKVVPITATSENQFATKKLGANLIATIGTERYAKKVTGEEYEKITKKVLLYNKKPSDKLKETIIKMLTPEATKKKAEKDALAAKTKGLKQQVKKVAKSTKKVDAEQKSLIDQLDELLSTDETAVEKLQLLLNKYKKVEEKRPQPVMGVRRSGEY